MFEKNNLTANVNRKETSEVLKTSDVFILEF